MTKILIVGGGYAGFYTAWKLEKWLSPGEAEVTVVDDLSTGKREMYDVFHEIADDAAFSGVVLVCAVSNVPAPSYPSQFAAVVSVARKCPAR